LGNLRISFKCESFALLILGTAKGSMVVLSILKSDEGEIFIFTFASSLVCILSRSTICPLHLLKWVKELLLHLHRRRRGGWVELRRPQTARPMRGWNTHPVPLLRVGFHPPLPLLQRWTPKVGREDLPLAKGQPPPGGAEHPLFFF